VTVATVITARTATAVGTKSTALAVGTEVTARAVGTALTADAVGTVLTAHAVGGTEIAPAADPRTRDRGADGTIRGRCGMRDLAKLYNEHFGLAERPFTLLPDPEFIYWAAPHSKAYTMLEYGIATHAPITMITGEVGSGKTTLLRKLLNDLPMDLSVGLVSNAQGDRGELLHWVLMALGQDADPTHGYVQLFRQFQNFLISEYAAGRRTVLIFDEAQNLSPVALEELRMFSNINADKDELLQLILVGQPELRALVRRPELRQFAQRIAAEFHLRALTAEETDAYILHRLHHAGAQREIFAPEARGLIHRAAQGVPRLVNQLCDYALVYAYAEDRTEVCADTVREVLTDRRQYGVFADPDAPEGAAPETPAARSDAPEGSEENVFYGIWDRRS